METTAQHMLNLRSSSHVRAIRIGTIVLLANLPAAARADDTGGSAYAWGGNTIGQLGNNSLTNR